MHWHVRVERRVVGSVVSLKVKIRAQNFFVLLQIFIFNSGHIDDGE